MTTENRKINVRVPPQNTESEKALLGSMILLPEIIKKIKKIVKPEYFYSTKNRILCYAMFDLDSKEIPIDVITLKTRLEAARKLDEAGGLSYITECSLTVPTASNAEHYAKIVKEKYNARKVIEASEEIANIAFDHGGTDKNVIETINKLFTSLKEGEDSGDQMERLKEVAKMYDGDDKVVSFQDVYDNLDKAEPIRKMHTGWSGLDDLLKGFRPKHIIILSGIMKHGKTSFAMDMTTKMSEWNPLWLAIEEPIEELMEKFHERGERPPVGFAPTNVSFVNTDWVERKIVEGIVNFDAKLVFIDNLDWVTPMVSHKGDNKTDRIEQTVREIKSLAKKWNVCIVLIVHVTKQSKADSNPTFEDFKGSVAIGQVADKAIVVWRETDRGPKGELVITNNTNVSVQLNRQGTTGNIKMVYENGHYKEFDWKTEEIDNSFGEFSNKNLGLTNKKE
jgi:replicative DNA helicase